MGESEVFARRSKSGPRSAFLLMGHVVPDANGRRGTMEGSNQGSKRDSNGKTGNMNCKNTERSSLISDCMAYHFKKF